MTCLQIHTDEESEDEIIPFVAKETEADLQEESEEEILSDAEAKLQHLQKLSSILQREEQPKAQEHSNMIYQQIYTEEESEKEARSSNLFLIFQNAHFFNIGHFMSYRGLFC